MIESKKHLRRSVGTVLLALVATVGVFAVPASAVSYSGSTSVSCGNVEWVYADYFVSGGAKITFSYTYGTLVTPLTVELWRKNPPGVLNYEKVGSGYTLNKNGTATWSGIGGGYFKFRVKNAGASVNCNGSAPGQGNWVLNYYRTEV